ncbi:MAG: hypothetical protein M0R17_05945 [Candidatus Omnitrophica bacterium]|jgi:putative flippase GtrA|nr:hypothetical protein [Candidatus Omnitrophota bacterium]
MSFEIICWIVAGIILSEVVFIIWTKKDKDNEVNWVGRKIISLLGTFLFMLIQIGIGCGFKGNIVDSFNFINYVNYLYELLIILSIGILFGINYLIQKKINGKTKK